MRRQPVLESAASPSERIFLEVLGESIRVLERIGLPYGLIGGIASAILGRPRWTHDVDVFVRPGDAPEILAAFARAGFAAEEKNPALALQGVQTRGSRRHPVSGARGHLSR